VFVAGSAHLKATLGLLLAAWLCWRMIRGLARVLAVCGFVLLLAGAAACGVPGDAGRSPAAVSTVAGPAR